MDSRDRGRKQQGYRKRLVTGISLGRGSKESSPGGIEHQAPPRPSDPGGEFPSFYFTVKCRARHLEREPGDPALGKSSG